MTIDQSVAAATAFIALLSLFAVIFQMRDSLHQRKLETQIRLYDINRDLLSLGFSHPNLFEVLSGKSPHGTESEKRYLQLWLNQAALVHSFIHHKAFDKDVQDSFERDIHDVMNMENMKAHWQKVEKYYPASFQEFVKGLQSKAGSHHHKAIKH